AFGDRKPVELTLDLLKVVGLVLRAADDGVPVASAVSRGAFRPSRRVLDEKTSAVDIPFAALPQRLTGKPGRQIPTPLSCLLELLDRHGGCSPGYDVDFTLDQPDSVGQRDRSSPAVRVIRISAPGRVTPVSCTHRLYARPSRAESADHKPAESSAGRRCPQSH